MNFCSNCGSDQLEFRVPEGDNRPRYVCANCGVIHYSNPKIVTGCLPVWRNKVLLAKRAIDPRKGYWNVPSGYLENGETVEQGAAREVWEETLAKVTSLTLHSVFSIPHISQVYIHFLAELDGPDFGVGEESLEARLFTESEVPWDEIAFTSSVFTLEHYFDDLSRGRREVHIGVMEHFGK
ncbi:MAG: NUDIX hydrolase [Phaeodactylibacter sp.]|nr:NUDIX hydrolase [Phaeodactylibacter sp.]MCB9288585.1 NUDIX hydrolase [Lewinellaceae bacterium]